MLNPAAFDALATDYDAEFSHTPLGQMLRQRVWDIYSRYFQPGQHLLELACGTGEDALWLAQQGLTITATDGAPEMLAITQRKAQQSGLAHQITIQPLALQSIASHLPPAIADLRFDGLYSNFGGLNTMSDWQTLAEGVAKLVRPDGIVILVLMGPICLWEMIWYLGHGDRRLAMRRFNQPVTAVIGQSVIPIWYPSARRLRHDFAPWFQHITTESLGLWLPPTYLGHLVAKRPSLFHRLNQLEKATAHLTCGWGDHYILLLKRNSVMT
jgi:ubiquinone/menaquinone biosynthesis C-methylase UbiE